MSEPLFTTEILRVTAETPEPHVIKIAAERLRRGEIVAFPTETVYGLGANALDPAAVARIYAAKGRPSRNPLIVHVADSDAAWELVTEWPQTAPRLAAAFWPGPLTLVLPRRNILPDIVTGGGPTVGLRVPAHPVALALLRAAAVPLAAPSANRSLGISPTQAAHVAASLHGRIPLILDGGPTTGGLESTVLDLTENPPRLLRPGLIPPAAIEAVIGPIARPNESATIPNDAPLPAPGMLTRHYAPNAALILADNNGEREIEAGLRNGLRVGWLTFAPQNPRPNLTAILMPDTPAGYAARLYAALHELDAQNVDCIVVEQPPDTEDWLAIHDRLERAAAPPETSQEKATRA